MSRKPQSTIRPILDDDIEAAAQFLHVEMNPDVPAAAWSTAMRSPWQHEPPNHGMLLTVDDELAGVHLAFYSRRRLGDTTVDVCNLGAWCVVEEQRFRGLRLLNRLLDQSGYEFVDLSPSGNVVALNERLGFEHLDTTTFMAPNLPWPTAPGRIGLSTDPATIAEALTGEDRRIYDDHRDAAAVDHLLLSQGDRHCHVMYRLDRRKNLPLFATIVYVSDHEVFAAGQHHVARHLLVRRGRPVMLGELRNTGSRPKMSRLLETPRPKMFKSDTLRADDIDDLYSELVAVAW